MKRLFIGSLVTLMVIGSVVAKPKAKAVPSQEIPELTQGQVWELLRKTFLPFKEVSSDYLFHKSTASGVPEYYFVWFVGLDDQSSWDKSVWSSYEVEVNPYKKEVRGYVTKEDFVRENLEYWASVGSRVLSQDELKRIDATDYTMPMFEGMGRFCFIWVVSDGIYKFMPSDSDNPSMRYQWSQGDFIHMVTNPKTGKFEGTGFRWSNVLRQYFIASYSSKSEYTGDVYSFEDFSPLLESRLKKEGTAEQLAQWELIKSEMQSYFAE